MNKSLAAITLALLLAPMNASAQERVGDAALGAASGLILGPIGVVAGAVVGYTAGPTIASAWGLRRSQRVHRAHTRRHATRASSIASRQATPFQPPVPGHTAQAQEMPAQTAPNPAVSPAASPLTASSAPVPVQGFE